MSKDCSFVSQGATKPSPHNCPDCAHTIVRGPENEMTESKDDASMVSLLTDGLEKILQILPRRFKDLKVQLQAVLEKLQEGPADASEYFPVLKMACETNVPKVQVHALDTLEKLMAYGYISGEGQADTQLYPSSRRGSRAGIKKERASGEQGSSKTRLMDVIIDTVYECSMLEDDVVQLQVMKALLTAVTAIGSQVHDHSLLLAVRACYHIFLMSRNDINRTTAKGTLTQMLNIILKQMEHFSTQLKQLEATLVSEPDEAPPVFIPPPDSVTAEEDALGSEADSLPKKFGKYGTCVVCGRPANHYCMHTKQPVCQMDCKISRLKDVVANVDGSPSSDPRQQRLVVGAKFILQQNDAYLLFRNLCKLSIKVLPEPSDSVALRSKILSLELLFSVLQGSGEVFRNTPRFIALVKEELVMSLLKNSVTPIEIIFRLSSQIFVNFVTNFKQHLKTEIGVFIDTVFLKILASPNSSQEHKLMALQVLRDLCSEPQTLVELFLNFDCGHSSFDTFQHTVSHVVKAARLPVEEDSAATDARERVRKAALETLNSIFNSLVEWMRRSNEEPGGAAGGADAAGASSSASPSDRHASPLSGSEGDGRAEEHSASSSPSFSKAFELAKVRQQKLETGCLKFNGKPKKGLAYLLEAGVVEETPEATALFFRECTQWLNKELVGDFIGDEHDFNRKVLYAYVEHYDFRNLHFDEAIRTFLSGGFRLPGEAQKIDRIMETFAAHFLLHNPGSFRSAETAYVLAYAVVMLNTDAHSPFVKNKMTKKQFISNNRGIDDGQDVDPDYLSKIYDKIVQDEIIMKDDPYRTAAEHGKTHDVRKRTHIFLKEIQQIVQNTEKLIKSEKPKKRTSHSSPSSSKAPTSQAGAAEGDEEIWYAATAKDYDAVLPMFEIIWYPALATFSVLLEETEVTLSTAQLCLQGYRYAIRLSARYRLDTPRLAFVSSLKKFTLLGTTKEMKPKNIEAIKALLRVALDEGNDLRGSWQDVMEVVSEFNHLTFIDVPSSADVFQSSAVVSAPAGGAQEKASPMSPDQAAARKTAQQQQHTNLQNPNNKLQSSTIDKIFTQSAKLDSDAIVFFVDSLRLASEKELADAHSPRVFCLQKIVEITYYNMDRIRLVWSRIWKILSGYFQRVGCHPNLNVSMYAIDSLKQLAMKFLEKAELANYQFQKQFLRPFGFIMKHNPIPEIRELVVQCLSRTVLARHENVKSGWKSVFAVMTLGAQDVGEQLVQATFTAVETLLSRFFEPIVGAPETIDEVVKCLVAFGCNKFADISLKAVFHLFQCSRYLSSQETVNPATPAATAPNSCPLPKSLKVWFLVLTGLSRLATDSRLEVRSRSLQVLFKVLHQLGDKFPPSIWTLIFRGVLLPTFDDVAALPDGDSELPTAGRPKDPPLPGWLQTTCLSALVSLVDLYSSYRAQAASLLPDLLHLVERCMQQPGFSLASLGVRVWGHLVRRNGRVLSTSEWKLVTGHFANTMEVLVPRELAQVRDALVAQNPPSTSTSSSSSSSAATPSMPVPFLQPFIRLALSPRAHEFDAASPEAAELLHPARAFTFGVQSDNLSAKGGKQGSAGASGSTQDVGGEQDSKEEESQHSNVVEVMREAGQKLIVKRVVCKCRVQMQLLQACRRLLAMFFPELQEAGEGVWVGLEGVPGVLSGAALMELLKRRRGEYEALQEQYQKAGMEREVQLLAPYLSRLTELWAEAEAGGGG